MEKSLNFCKFLSMTNSEPRRRISTIIDTGRESFCMHLVFLLQGYASWIINFMFFQHLVVESSLWSWKRQLVAVGLNQGDRGKLKNLRKLFINWYWKYANVVPVKKSGDVWDQSSTVTSVQYNVQLRFVKQCLMWKKSIWSCN